MWASLFLPVWLCQGRHGHSDCHMGALPLQARRDEHLSHIPVLELHCYWSFFPAHWLSMGGTSIKRQFMAVPVCATQRDLMVHSSLVGG